MRLYDPLIQRIYEIVGRTGEVFTYDERKPWPENDNHEMILQRDTAYELGGAGNPAVNITCVTSDEALFAGEGQCLDRITVIGDDLQEITGDTPYARISILLTEEMNPEEETATETVYQTLQDIDFVKYHVYPKGYMVRTSGQSGREQVRVSKEALRAGCSFERIGATFIKHYLETGKVKRAHVIFITLEDMDYKSLEKKGFQAGDIKNSLSKIKNGLPTECSICDIKDICNEVEGLREYHFGRKDRQKRGTTV